MPTVDPADSKSLRWFLQKGRAIRLNNSVETFFEAEPMWARMKRDMDAATGFIYLVGLDLELACEMGVKGSPTLQTALEDADLRGVQVRAMLQNFSNNPVTVPWINGLTNGAAILDDKRASTHHQKVVVISTKAGVLAYCGGMDIQHQRIPWHDLHARVTGPAAEDLQLNFVQRWRDHPDSAGLKTVETPKAQKATSSDQQVQVLRTFGKAGYSFAPKGEHGIYDVIKQAIGQTKEFIYLEDQYLTNTNAMKIGPAISTLLATKLREESFKLLVILIARTESLNYFLELGNPRQGWHRRKKFIDELRRAAAGKVVVCQYKRVDPNVQMSYDTPTFVHSKTWVFDDRFTVFGSANVHRVGYTMHSEVDLAIADANTQANRAFFAHDLRNRLWLKHLNPIGGNRVFHEKDVADPFAAATYWRCPHPQSPIEPYDVDGHVNALPDEQDSLPADPEASWERYDPDGSA